MQGKKIGSGRVSNFEYSSHSFGHEVLHRLRIMGKVGLPERLEMYNRLLELNPSSSMYCLLDNSYNFENSMSYADLGTLDELLLNAGIKTFFGAVVTYDSSYSLINKLATRSAQLRGLDCDLMSTSNSGEAEAFLMSKLARPAVHELR